MKEKILQAAERRVRKAGFAEMSFRDLAQDVGIKSASVHYHFPTKSDLGAALIDRYTQSFRGKLDGIDQSTPKSALDGFAALYTSALVVEEAICLCAIMGAEANGLPESVNQTTRAFFEMNRTWLEDLFETHSGLRHADAAAALVAALEGGMILASVARDRRLMDGIARTAVDAALARLAT
ncbi:MAG: TetR/AcrR family transcriptional regulator [Pseudomonadota bacterium]